MQPFYTTLGTKGRRPDGCHMPLCAAGAGPFGNIGKHRPGPDPDRAERRLNPQARQGLSISRQRRHKKRRPKGRSPPQWNGTSYLPRAGALNPPVRRSRSQAEPLAPRAKGPAAPSTLAAKPRQPSGILESTAPPTGIYRAMIHYRRIPRSFVSLRMTSGRRDSPATSRQPPSTLTPFRACP